MADYYKDGVARVLEVIRDALGEDYTYFNGQPDEITEDVLPCVMVSETSGQITSGATGTDDINETILVIIALNKKDDLGATDTTELTELRLRRLVKGQDPATSQYLPGTVMYAVRKHLTMSEVMIGNKVQTDFDIAQRGADVYTQEAYVSISLERLALVPSRD